MGEVEFDSVLLHLFEKFILPDTPGKDPKRAIEQFNGLIQIISAPQEEGCQGDIIEMWSNTNAR